MQRDFKFALPITRSYTEGNVLYLEGAASDSSPDRLKGVMAPWCIEGFVNCVKFGTPAPVFDDMATGKMPAKMPDDMPEMMGDFGIDNGGVNTPDFVVIDSEHSEAWHSQIGYAVDAKVINNLEELPPEHQEMPYVFPVFWVKLAIDMDYSQGKDLAVAINKGRKLGLSIAGEVVKSHNVNDGGTPLTIFDEVWLKKIAITKQPANRNTWLSKIARSMMAEENTTLETEQKGEALEEATPVTEAAQEEQAPVIEAVSTEVEAQPEQAASLAPEAAVVADEAVTEATPETDAPEAPEVEFVEPVTAATDGAVTEEAPETVERAYVERAYIEQVEATLTAQIDVLRSECATLKSLLADVPAFIEAQQSRIGELTDALEVMRSELAAANTKADEAAIEINLLKAQPMGRRGTLARSSINQEAADAVSSFKKLKPEEQAQIIAQMRAEGKAAEAALLLIS